MSSSTKLFAAMVPVLCALASSPALANPLSAQEFAEKAKIAGEFEISASQIAAEKSQNDDVKKFAQEMIADHTLASNTLKATLPASTVNPGAIADRLDTAHQDKLDELRQADANSFDAEYVEIQEEAHKEAVALFADYAKNGQDKALQTFAANTLPTLQEHLKHVTALDDKIDD